ncbi:MAG: polysaccharide pyruvyl transferase family protein, partial [Marinobacter sp.]
EDIFLGDPGSMIREIALLNDDRSLTNSGKKYKLGIIPHFVDYPYVQRSFYNDPSVLVIDIKNRYDLVAKKIKGCEAIVSSSLHGLIFSDAIGVPNSWVSISDRIVGGDFKFNDYYSVCDLGKIKNTCRDKKSIMNASERSFVSNPLFYFKMKNLVNNEFFKYA